MTEVNLGIRISNAGVDVGGIKVTREELDKLNVTQTKLQTQNAQMAQAQDKITQSAQTETNQFKQLETELDKLLSRLDPVYNKTKQLDSANELLHQGLKAGVVTQSQYDDALGKLAQGFESSAASAEKSAFHTAGAKRELIVLGHEALTGNFSRMPGSFMVLAERMSITEALFNPMTLGIGAIGIAAVVMGVAFAKGATENDRLNQALIKSGNIAGGNAGAFNDLANKVGKVSGEYSTSHEAITALSAGGVVSAKNIEVALDGVVYGAKVTGESVDSLVKKFEEISKDPLKATIKLNEQYNYLTVSTYEQIKSLEKQGKTQEAVTVAYKAFADSMKSRSVDINQNLGTFEQYWIKIKEAIDGAKQSFLEFGKTDSNEKQLSDAQQRLAVAKQQYADVSKDSPKDLLDKMRVGVIAAEVDVKMLESKISAVNARATNASNDANTVKAVIAKDTKKPDSSVKKEEESFKSISAELDKYSDSIKLADEMGKKLTHGQELQISVNDRLKDGTLKLTATDQLAIKTKIDGILADEKVIAHKKELKDLAEAEKKAWDELAVVLDKKTQLDIKDLDSMQASTAAIEDKIKVLQAQSEEYGLSDKALKELKNTRLDATIADLEASKALVEESDLRMSQIQAIDEHIDALRRLNVQEDAQQPTLQKTKTLSKDLGLTFTSAFENAVIGGKKFSDVLSSLGQDIERVILRITVIEPIIKAITNEMNSSGGLGGLFDQMLGGLGIGSGSGSSVPTGNTTEAFPGAGAGSASSSSSFGDMFSNFFSSKSAKGNIFNAGHQMAFANGGAFTNSVVSSPTMFPMGLMGEAGPEAILPLSRGANGKLGVQTTGGGIGGTGSGLNLIVNLVEAPGAGKGGQTQTTQSSGGNKTLTIFVEQITSKMSADISRGAGLGPVLESTYGLNRAAGAHG